MNGPTRSSARLQATRSIAGSAKRHKIDHVAEQPKNEITSTSSEDRITETPRDILYEIFNYLEPLDLLHLSWSSKALNSIVMGKSARFIWENAFEGLHPPPPKCPPDLNLAQYTRFLFNKQCLECNSLHDTYVTWSLRASLCNNCLEGKGFSVLMDRQYRALLPCVFIRGKHRPYVRADELNEVKATLGSMEPDSREWTEYVKQREEYTDSMQLGEKDLLRWQKEQNYGFKEARQNTIIQRLNELGWKDELDRLSVSELQALPGMGTAKPLTDKGWKTHCPRIIAHLETIRNLRLERERQSRIVERCHTLSTRISSWAIKQSSPDYMLPRVLDAAFSEPFKSFIFHDSDTEPTFITNDDELERTMKQFTEEWNEARIQFLLSLIPTSTGPDGEQANGKGKATPSSVLNLATTIFHCPSGQVSCPSGMDNTSYPHILAHECQRPIAAKKNCRDTDPEGFQLLSTGLYSRPWLLHPHRLSFDRQASDAARVVVEACGENPDEVTAERMDEIDCRLQCTRVQENHRYIVNWRMAVRHEALHSRFAYGAVSPPGEAKWHLITDPEDLALIHAAEKAAKPVTAKLECKLCHIPLQNTDAKTDLELMQTHWGACSWVYSSIPYRPDLDDRLIPLISVYPLQVPEEKALRTMFKVQTVWCMSHLDVVIPPRKVVDKDDKVE